MDDVALTALWNEMKKDVEVAIGASQLVKERLSEGTPAALDSAAHHYTRFFNVVEQMGLRIAKAFENNIDDERGWHAELIRRMTIGISGVRPPLFPDERAPALRELRRFRHVFNHAYDLEVDVEKLQFLQRYLDRVATHLASDARRFIEGVAAMHGLTVPAE